jgi:hypothetical protein
MFDPCPGNCTEPVDEEAELFEELWSMEYRITGDKPKAMKFAREFLDHHAHVLAEKIRTTAQARHDRDYSDNRVFRLTGALSAAADIDPEATR